MKRVGVFSVVVALFVLVGCSGPEPEGYLSGDEPKTAQNDAERVPETADQNGEGASETTGGDSNVNEKVEPEATDGN